MTIAKITGNGYEYLLRHTARGDAEADQHTSSADYYTAAGNPPGQWLGRGAPLLGLDGKQVEEDAMRALFGFGQHPNGEEMISRYIREHHRPGMTPEQERKLTEQAVRHATLGHPFPDYAPIEHYDQRVKQRLELIAKETGRDPTEAEVRRVKAQEARRQRAAVAGFDLVFSPVKSAALLWAVDERPEVRNAIRQAHLRAMQEALDLIEDHAAYTRTGHAGIAQIETKGLIAAAFEHWDSRAGDPNLHTHVAISTKVQGVDGKWRSLDARGLYRMTVAASELYNTAFETHLTSLLGVTFTARPDTAGGREPVREIEGVPPSMIEYFSRRRTMIEARYAELLREYRREHGTDPTAEVGHKLARQATLETRKGKKPPRSLADKRGAWRDELADRFGERAVEQLMATTGSRAEATSPEPPRDPDLDNLAERIVGAVASQRSTWTVWNVRAEAERLVRTELPGLAPGSHRDLTDRVTALAVSPKYSISVEAPSLLDEPDELRRSDGESVFAEHRAARFTSQAVLDAEQRLLDATRTPTVNGLAGQAVAAAIDGFEGLSGTELDPGQRDLVTAFATDDRLLLAGIGPAGAGKTTAMRAYSHVLRQAGRHLVPLATSAAAADVLARELSLPAENLHKFLHEWTRGPGARKLRAGETVPSDLRKFALRPGDVVLVDEAGMAGTFLLDQLVSIAASRGATVRLLGDDRQLSAVEGGGALRLIASQEGTPELTVLHRFKNPEEGDATLRIRAGDTSAVDWYARNGRIRTGSREWMAQAAYDGWKADMLAGKSTMMAAADGGNVTELSAQARADRVDAGQVEADGVMLRDGNLAGAGDWIVTRDNNRRLSVNGGRDWVKNGDAWTVEQRHDDGSLTVRNMGHGGRVTLPADYVKTHVQLLYAYTAHRVQGGTVDTAHPLVTEGMTREALYVLASRARECTTFYVATYGIPFDDDERLDAVAVDPRQFAAREVLVNVIGTEGAALSATETIATAQEDAGSLHTLVPRYLHAAHEHADARYRSAVTEVFGEDEGSELTGDPAWGAVVQRLYKAEGNGWDPADLLVIAKDSRELATAESIAEVMSWRIDAILEETPQPPPDGHVYERPADAKARLADLALNVIGARHGERARSEQAWPALIAVLRRAESQGRDAGKLLGEAVRAQELRSARSVSEVLAWRVQRRLTSTPAPSSHAREQATAESDGSVRNGRVLPWLVPPPGEVAERRTLPGYLWDATSRIDARVNELAERALGEHPAWMSMLGQQPDSDSDRAQWRRQVAVIAAYRDQFQVQTDDPRQVLGPYPESGHAGRGAYWEAAQAVLTARRLAGVDHPVPGRPEPEPAQAQVASDIYRTLPPEERASVAMAVAEQAGVRWFGDRHAPDEEAVLHGSYADLLTAELSARGHVTARSSERNARVVEEPVEAEYARRSRTHRSNEGSRPSPARGVQQDDFVTRRTAPQMPSPAPVHETGRTQRL